MIEAANLLVKGVIKVRVMAIYYLFHVPVHSFRACTPFFRDSELSILGHVYLNFNRAYFKPGSAAFWTVVHSSFLHPFLLPLFPLSSFLLPFFFLSSAHKKTPAFLRASLKAFAFAACGGLLPGVVFHDELFFELDRNLIAERELHERTFHLGLVDGEVFRSFRSVCESFLNLHVFLGTFTEADHVAGLDLTSRGEATNAVDSEMAVSNILAGSEDRAGETHAVDESVEASFEDDHQVITSRTGAAVCFIVSLGELSFRDVVGEAEALLFNELLLVNGGRLLASLTMLARCKVTAIESLLSLLRNGKAERTGYFAFWSTEGGHVIPL